MGNYTYLKKFIEFGDYENASTDKMSDNYSNQYKDSISSFDILINSDRANNIYRNGILYKAIVDYGSQLKKGELASDKYRKEVRTRHSDNFKVGNIVEYENKGSLEKQTYLFLNNIETKDGYDLSVMQKCNSTFPLKGETTKTLTGYNAFGEPQYTYIEGDPILLPCIVESTFNLSDTDKAVNLPEGKIRVIISYITHEDVAVGKEFFMYNEKYEITGIDYTKSINQIGILIINGERRT